MGRIPSIITVAEKTYKYAMAAAENAYNEAVERAEAAYVEAEVTADKAWGEAMGEYSKRGRDTRQSGEYY